MKTKRIFAFFMAIVLAILLCSCGEKKEVAKVSEENDFIVLYPMSDIPNYVLNEGATPDEMRQMAIQAMRDELTVPWFTKTEFSYNKKVNGEASDFVARTNYQYCGLPYTDSGTGLLHWLTHYNFETGEVTDIDSETLNKTLGNSCATSVSWGWASVITSFKGIATFSFNKSYGAIPVGDYAIPSDLVSYKTYTTQRICEDNGKDKMYQAYAQVQPADGIISYPNGGKGMHAMMAIEKAYVVYDNSGNIDEKKSHLVIQDQRAGQKSNSTTYVVVDEDGNKSHYSGRTSAVIPFIDLFENGYYIPVTNAEFMGQKPYALPEVSVDKKDAKSLSDISSASVHSNFRMVTITLSATDPKTGKVVGKATKMTTDTTHKYKLSDLARNDNLVKNLKKGTEYQFKVDVLVSAGVTKTPIDVTFKYK